MNDTALLDAPTTEASPLVCEICPLSGTSTCPSKGTQACPSC